LDLAYEKPPFKKFDVRALAIQYLMKILLLFHFHENEGKYMEFYAAYTLLCSISLLDLFQKVDNKRITNSVNSTNVVFLIFQLGT
jgi:hypothetical protein